MLCPLSDAYSSPFGGINPSNGWDGTDGRCLDMMGAGQLVVTTAGGMLGQIVMGWKKASIMAYIRRHELEERLLSSTSKEIDIFPSNYPGS